MVNITVYTHKLGDIILCVPQGGKYYILNESQVDEK